MRNRLKILLAVILIFVLNLIFYVFSEDYRFFWEKLKNSGEVVYVEDTKVSDEEKLPEGIERVDVGNRPSKTLISSLEDVQDPVKKPEEPVEVAPLSPLQTEIFLGANYQKILKKFENYNLDRQDENYKLFGLTEEYPDPYIEYYGNDLSLYFFPTKSYQDVKDIFTVLIGEIPVSLNEVNNFGDKSFYINLDEIISDDNVRIIIAENGIVFGLKIKKSGYNAVKNILLGNPVQ